MSKYEIGDTVKLKSGGPVMTIEHIGSFPGYSSNSARCNWFVNDELKTGIFDMDALETAEPKKTSSSVTGGQ